MWLIDTRGYRLGEHVKIPVSGGTRLLGQGLLEVFRESEEHEVRCFVRITSPTERLEGFGIVYDDARDVGSVEKALCGTDTFVRNTGLEYAPHVLETMRLAEIERLREIGMVG